MKSVQRYAVPAAAILALAIGLGFSQWGTASAGSETLQTAPKSKISGDPNNPRRHFRVRNAAELDESSTRRNYRNLIDDMVRGYALSGDSTAGSYRRWKKYNTSPYASATHGRRYVNNYANATARAYGKFESAGVMPQGAILAKDSFMAAEDGSMAAGPLFVMEKMASGFNYVSGDWRYTMIMPDGSIFGTTKGENAKRVEFCIGCHLAREKFDHLFFIPKAFRESVE